LCIVSGPHVLCPYLEVNLFVWSSLGVTRRFVVVDAAIVLVTDGFVAKLFLRRFRVI